MIPDAIAYAKWCHACQIHGDFIHQAPRYLHRTSSLWPFEMWGMYVIGPISPPISKWHRFIFALADYFSKWVKVVRLKKVKASNVIKFTNITYSTTSVYPDESSTIMDPNSSAKYSKGSVINLESKVYHQRHTANSLAEAFNKTIGKLLKKFVSKSQRDWDDKLGECLWAYRTMVRTLAKGTLFSMVYWCEAVLPLSKSHPSELPWKPG